jgi:hypothetical protein
MWSKTIDHLDMSSFPSLPAHLTTETSSVLHVSTGVTWQLNSRWNIKHRRVTHIYYNTSHIFSTRRRDRHGICEKKLCVDTKVLRSLWVAKFKVLKEPSCTNMFGAGLATHYHEFLPFCLLLGTFYSLQWRTVSPQVPKTNTLNNYAQAFQELLCIVSTVVDWTFLQR